MAVNKQTFAELYEEALDGKNEAKFAFFLENRKHAIFNTTYKRSLTIMQKEKLSNSFGLVMVRNAPIFNHVNRILDRLIPSGIAKHLIEYGSWHLSRPLPHEFIDPRKILSMSDLEFGFVIWLVACFASFLVFVYERCGSWIDRKCRNLLVIIDFVKLLKWILADYHDRW